MDILARREWKLFDRASRYASVERSLVRTQRASGARCSLFALPLLYLLIPSLSDGAESGERTSRRVVVVHMANFLIPASVLAETAMREALVAHAKDSVVFETEALGVLAEMELAPQQELREVQSLTDKYATLSVDLVLAVGSVALDFVERNRHQIWPNAPVFYYGVSDRRIDDKTFVPDVGGLTIHFDVSGTLEIAMQMQPYARHIVYAGGAAPYDKVFEPLFMQAVAPHRARLRVTKLIGLSPAALEQELARLPRESIVLYTSIHSDEAGASYVSADLVGQLTASSAAPVYSFFGSYLGNGIVGGSTIDFEEHGRRAGLLAARVLNGNSTRAAASVPHVAFPSACTLDVRRMEHWRIPPRLAPVHCELLFRAQPFWLAHREALLLAAGALILLALMCVALHTQARKRSTAEQEASRQRQEAIHTARLALVGEISGSIVHEVTQPLSAILSNTDAAEMLLDKGNPSLEEIRAILSDIRRDDARAHGIVLRLRSLLKKGELHVAIIDPNELTASALELIRPEARHRSVVLRSSPDPALPQIVGDAVHLQQVLLNLLVNALDALEAVPTGDRVLEVSTSRHGSDAVCITVRDTGRGIAPEVLPRIFESFATTKRGGLGLGLSISKTIVDAHGGDLTATTLPSRGAVFRLTLPAAADQAHHSA